MKKTGTRQSFFVLFCRACLEQRAQQLFDL